MKCHASASLVSPRLRKLAVWGCALTFTTCLPTHARAQSIVKQPGMHPAYSVDLEPHLVFALDAPYYGGGGFGLGARATIPFLRNGPIQHLNNDMGIGFGLDWVSWGSCRNGLYANYPQYPYYNYNCSAYEVYVPVTLQWNFYLTDIITVYGEPGFAIRYAHVSWTLPLGPGGAPVEVSDHVTDPVPIIAGGAKFMFGRTIGLNVRLGWPYCSVGASFLL
jgi:hypothetical protein